MPCWATLKIIGKPDLTAEIASDGTSKERSCGFACEAFCNEVWLFEFLGAGLNCDKNGFHLLRRNLLCSAREIDLKARRDPIQRLAVDAKNFGRPLAVAASRLQHVQQIASL